MPRDIDRPRIASLAHATAHEITALREVDRRIKAAVLGDAPTITQVQAILAGMIRDRERKCALMADQVAGHA